MALRFVDSFDHYTTSAQLALKWDYLEAGGTAAISAGQGRNGTQALTNNSSNHRYVAMNFDNRATWIAGVAFKWNTAISTNGAFHIEFLVGTSPQVGVYLNLAGTVSVRRGGSGGTILATSVNSFSADTYYYCEFKATIDNAGTYEFRVNGSSVGWIPSASGDTQNDANAYANAVGFMPGASNRVYLDDVYICDTSGTTNNNFLGDVRVAAVFPNAVGTYSQFTPTSGDNYTCVDETTPNNDTDFVATSGIDFIDTYNFAALPVASGTILGIQVVPFSRKDDAGSRSLVNVIYYNSILYSGGLLPLGDTYLYYPEIFETNPDTDERWTIPEVNSAEFGPKLGA